MATFRVFGAFNNLARKRPENPQMTCSVAIGVAILSTGCGGTSVSITFDAASNDRVLAGSTSTFAHTVSGLNRLLVCGVPRLRPPATAGRPTARIRRVQSRA